MEIVYLLFESFGEFIVNSDNPTSKLSKFFDFLKCATIIAVIEKSKIEHLAQEQPKYDKRISEGDGNVIRVSKPRDNRLETIAIALIGEMYDRRCDCRHKPFVFQLRRRLIKLKVEGDWKYSYAWFQSFLKRNKLSVKRKAGKKRGADSGKAEEFTNLFSNAVQDLNIPLQHLFNCDETAVVHIPQPQTGVGI